MALIFCTVWPGFSQAYPGARSRIMWGFFFIRSFFKFLIYFAVTRTLGVSCIYAPGWYKSAFQIDTPFISKHLVRKRALLEFWILWMPHQKEEIIFLWGEKKKRWIKSWQKVQATILHISQNHWAANIFFADAFFPYPVWSSSWKNAKQQPDGRNICCRWFVCWIPQIFSNNCTTR